MWTWGTSIVTSYSSIVIARANWRKGDLRPRDLMYSSHKPECIVRTNPDRSALIIYHSTRSTQKARFDSKMHGSTQKSLVRHKNARFDTKMPSLACISWHCHYQTHTPQLPWEIFFIQFYSNILAFKNPLRNDNEIILIWIHIFSISLWNLKCNLSCLFVKTIISAAIDKCYGFGKMFCQFVHFFIAPLKSDTHVAHCCLNYAPHNNFCNYSQ